MRFLHVINNLANGGAEKILVEFLPKFRLDNDVELLVLTDKGSLPKYKEELIRNGVKVNVLSKGNVYNPLLIFKINSYLNKNKYDVIHVHLFPSLYFVSIAKTIFRREEKLVFTEHSNINKRLSNPLLKPLDKWIYKAYDQVIAISDSIKVKLDDWLEREDLVRVVKNGINLEKFTDTHNVDLSAFKKNKEKVYFLLMSARFGFPKRQDLIIKLMSTLPEEYILLLAGDGAEKAKCEELAEELNLLNSRVFFLGHREDIVALMQNCDLNILYTEYEGMSGVAIEAQASGKPFLGSDVLGVNDVVVSKENVFINFEDEKILHKIKVLCTGNTDDLVERQIQKSKTFEMNNMVNGYNRVYQRVFYNKVSL